MKAIFLPLTACAAIALVFAQGSAPQTQIKAPVAQVSMEDRIKMIKSSTEGKALPEFKMKRLDDVELTNKDIKGKVVVIDFWATWCGPCKAAAPTLNAIHDEFKDKGLMVIGANLAERGPDNKRIQTKDNAVAYVKEHGYGYTFTYGNDDLGKQWKVPGYPTFFIVDKKGVVREVMVGFNDDRMRELVVQLTNE